MAFSEILTPFFDVAGFAITATLDGALVNGIFDNGYADARVGPYGMASTRPTLTLPTSLVPASPVGKTAVVGTASYTVAAHEPDGTGVSVLILESA